MNWFQANLCLLCVTFCWSTDVLVYACLPPAVPGVATVAVTSLAGAALLLVPFGRRVAAALRRDGRHLLLAGLLLAALNVARRVHFLAGMRSFDATEGTFVNCMGVVVLPGVMLAMRRRVAPATWLSVALVGAGMVLALLPTMRTEHLRGLFLIGVGSVFYSLSVVLLADLVRKHDPVAVGLLRHAFMGLFALAGWYATDPRLFAGLEGGRTLAAAWAVFAYLSVALAQALNVFAIRRVSAADATLVYSLKLVFTLALGVLMPAGLVARIGLTPRVLASAALVVAGSLTQLLDLGGARKAA